MRPVVLMRTSFSELGEFDIASSLMTVIKQRTDACSGDIIIPRYSLLPYPKELELDMLKLGAKLINSTQEHLYTADIENWYSDFENLTPRTWFRLHELTSSDYNGPIVFKGKTNSRKANWRTHMFAASKEQRRGVIDRLLDDTLISDQGIIARQFETFETFDHITKGINGLPVTNEWRSFILDGNVITTGFYWSEHYDDIHEAISSDEFEKHRHDAYEFVSTQIAPILKSRIRFCVADVAKHIDGRWRLVELNDGSMSGTSCCDIEQLYRALSALEE